MKRFFLYLTTILTLAASCSESIQPYGTEDTTVSLSATLRIGTKSSGITPVVNSVRVLAFDDNGICVLNSYTDTGLTTSAGSDGEYIVSLPSEFELHPSSSTLDFDIFAVLNESGHSLVGADGTLSDLLDGITAGSRSILTLRSFLSGKAAYTATVAGADEPAFLMGASTFVSIPSGHSISSENPYPVEFDIIQRSLAQVSITGIYSDVANLQVAGIQIQELSLVNVPSGFSWAGTNGTLGKSPLTIVLAEPASNGYIEKTSDETSFSVTYSDLMKSINTSNSLYVTADGTMGFVDKAGAKQYGKIDDVSKAYEKFGQKNFSTLLNTTLPTYFNSLSGGNTLTYTLGDPVISNLATWSIDLGNSYYIPENISSAASTATCIKVRAILTTPGIDDDTIVDRASWGSYIFKTNGNSFNGVTLDDAPTKAFMQSNLKYETYEVTDNKGNVSTKYLSYIDGLSREQTAEPVTVTNEWTPTSHVYDFLIPVSSDFSVRRGTRYTITLHVDQGTYDNLATKSGLCLPPFGIRADVTTDKMNGYED